MNVNNSKHIQFELFPNSRAKGPQKKKQPFLFKSLTLSLENIIVLCIIFIMVLVVFFSFGVERGRRIASVDDAGLKSNVANSFESNVSDGQNGHIAVSLDRGSLLEKSSVGDQADKKENVETLSVPIIDKNDSDQFYTIQVASFKLIKNAKKEASGLKKKGYDIFVMPKGSHSIVCVGKFAQEKEAKKFSMRLKGRYGDCLVRRL